MTQALRTPVEGIGFRFPKSSRLLKSRDFQLRPSQRFQSALFRFVTTSHGQNRIGISLARKVLRRATARNRVRRLLREAFRLDPGAFVGYDVHVIGLSALDGAWERLTREDITRELRWLRERLAGHGPAR